MVTLLNDKNVNKNDANDIYKVLRQNLQLLKGQIFNNSFSSDRYDLSDAGRVKWIQDFRLPIK